MSWENWKDSNVLEFIYNSNMIENINIDKEEYMLGSPHPEIGGHWRAFQYLMLRKKLTSQCLLDTHKLLMEKLLYDKAGKYRNVIVTVGDNVPPPPYLVPHLVSNMILDIEEAGKLSEDDCWLFHDRFEIIHPFFDGNGRTGRLLLNYLRLKNGFPLKIVKYETKEKYYEKINNTRIRLGL